MTTRKLLLATFTAIALAACGGVPPPPPDAELAPTTSPPPAALGAATGRLTSAGYTLDVFLGDPMPGQRLSSSTHTLTPTTPVEP